MRVQRPEAGRDPWWRRALAWVGAAVVAMFRPLGRMWRSDDPLDAFGLVQLGSSAGDAMVAIALAGTVFFDVPVGEATSKVTAYLALTMAPIAVAGLFLVPLLDRAGPRRTVSLGAAAGRALAAAWAAPRFDSIALYPAAFVLLILSRVHTITRNGLVPAYTGSQEGLVRANARLGRISALGVVLAAPLAALLFKLGGAQAALAGASLVYLGTSGLILRLPHPRTPRVVGRVGPRGHLPALRGPAIGAAGLRAANGFLLLSIAFALRRSGEPALWFLLLGGAATLGAFLGDVVAPRLPASLREEAVVVACVIAAGLATILAFWAFTVQALVLFALVAGTSGELGRLAFQSLMQQATPGGAHGRVFVRYEVLFQLAWIAGALIPAVFPIGFRAGLLILFSLYAVVILGYLAPQIRAWVRETRRRPPR